MAYLAGRGGAPILIAAVPSKGVIVMEYIYGETINTIASNCLLSDVQWIDLLLVVAKRLKEVHVAGIVHSDLKFNNCIITTDAVGAPDAHLIDFGMSTKVGEKSCFPEYSDMKLLVSLMRKPWYAFETFRGVPLQPATDVVGFSHIAQVLMRLIFASPPREVLSLAMRGKAKDMARRPTIDDFVRCLEAARREFSRCQ